MSKFDILKNELESMSYENEKLVLFLKQLGLSTTEIISNIIYGDENDKLKLINKIKK